MKEKEKVRGGDGKGLAGEGRHRYRGGVWSLDSHAVRTLHRVVLTQRTIVFSINNVRIQRKEENAANK